MLMGVDARKKMNYLLEIDNKQVVERSRNHLFMSEAETTCL
jgi:hypothetical protein